jgi:hypothetical protein
MKRKPRASTVLRDLLAKHGAKEIARRTGYSERAIKSAAKTGKPSARMREEIRATAERSKRARKGAKTREKKKTRIPVETTERYTPKKIAEKLGKTEREVRAWIERGGTPKRVLDAAKQLGEGQASPYPLKWEAGRRTSYTIPEYEKLEAKLAAFVTATKIGDGEEIKRTYRAWRRAKVPLRRALTADMWDDMIERIGLALDLPDVGIFSRERFKRS